MGNISTQRPAGCPVLLLLPCCNFESYRTLVYAGFDPLFWLHHCMVDRVLWLFQNNGGMWVGSSKWAAACLRTLLGICPWLCSQTSLCSSAGLCGLLITSQRLDGAASLWAGSSQNSVYKCRALFAAA